VARYFADLWAGIWTTLVGMKVTGRYLFRKPVTMRYPEERPVVPEGYRGIHALREDHCHVCQGCAKACPVACIIIESVGKGKDQLITKFQIDYSKCLFCDLCMQPCPTGSLHMTQTYDLASLTRAECVLDLMRPKSAEEIAAFQAALAAKEAEKKAKAEAEAAEKAAAAKAAAEKAAEEKKE
jgi:NADH-quinone oxidoreductase subunit I